MYVEQPFQVSPTQLDRLRSLSSQLDISPGPGGSRMSAPDATAALYAPELRSAFDGHWDQAMLVALYPSAQLVGHADAPIRGVRYHLPLSLNDGCWVFHAGTWQQLIEGRCYQMTPHDTHGAVNWGATMRLHLMVDVCASST